MSDIYGFTTFLMNTSLNELKHYYEEMKDKIEDVELFNKWKDVINKTAENGFKTLDNTMFAVIIYFVYKMRGEGEN